MDQVVYEVLHFLPPEILVIIDDFIIQELRKESAKKCRDIINGMEEEFFDYTRYICPACGDLLRWYSKTCVDDRLWDLRKLNPKKIMRSHSILCCKIYEAQGGYNHFFVTETYEKTTDPWSDENI